MVNAGDVLGTYRMLAPLGVGGMGEVWIADHVLLGHRVAIKILKPEFAERADIVERFFDEARAAAQIADVGVVQVHDFGWSAKSCAYLVMELLVGESLAARLARICSMPSETAARLAQQIAMTMAIAHRRGIIHRDLKPDNIFLAEDPAVVGGERIKILDFGIAKLLGEHETTTRTRTGTILGTPRYMSPEQCRSSSTVDHRSDIYALGCVLFEMVCGRPPFRGDAPAELITAHLFEAPPTPSTLGGPGALDAVIASCLAKAPGDRMSTMTEVARALAGVSGTPCKRDATDPRLPRELAYQTTLGTSAGEVRIHATRPRPRHVAGVIAALVALAITGVASLPAPATRASAKIDARVVPAAPQVLVVGPDGATLPAPARAAPVIVAPAPHPPLGPHAPRSTAAPVRAPPAPPIVHPPRPYSRRALITPPRPPPPTDHLYDERGD
ncbi:MAG: protein kinase [Kofleriaceae bacterium]